MTAPLIYWYRQDLRISDLPALSAAVASGQPLLACYILDDQAPGEFSAGSASRWWLHHSLLALREQIHSLGGQLVLRRGATWQVLAELIADTGADSVYCTRQYEPWGSALEATLHQELAATGITLKRYGGNLLFEPGTVMTQGGGPFKVFTPFWRNCLAQPQPPQPRPPVDELNWHTGKSLSGDELNDWELCPASPDWASHWGQYWQPGTVGARQKLRDFLAAKVDDYSEGRNHPARDSTSRLSAHLHFGELSPREVWHAARAAAGDPARAAQIDKFLSELGWREFSSHLMHHFPTLAELPFKSQFEDFPWLGSPAALAAWQRGQTGYPIVDAGMRELWHTGYMHNRIRMVVASFLTKHLLIHWRAGARWFWDTLVDADLANNSSGWQWVAGSGADASPYFRIFNPITQGEKFDEEGRYIRQWVPELAKLPDRYLNRPWEAPAELLENAGVVMGQTYPMPIVDHRAAREAALAAYGSIKG